MPSSRLFGLILAAGQGRRFGGDKLLQLLNGKPLLLHVLDWVTKARKAGGLAGSLAVLPEGDRARETLVRQSGIEYAFNPSPEAGVAESLRIGLRSLAARHPDANAALVLQGDQPRIPPEVLPLLVAQWGKAVSPVIRPRYAGDPTRPGHPVLIDRTFWQRADDLKGDAGFAPLLQEYPDLVTIVDVPGINPDINTPSDLALLESASP
jgi:molybdenum cofactor cytidylyltransferase